MNKTLIFKPEGEGVFKESVLYAVSIFSKIFALCAQYVFNSLRQPLGVKATDDYISLFWRLQFEHTYTSLYASGQEYLNSHETYIFMSNHGSWMDIPAMFGATPGSLRMVAKAGLMQVPVLGHAMSNAGFIAIDRKNRTRAIRQLAEAKRRLREGISIWIAPEGTRSRNGSIAHFKKGGFYLAKELKKSIVPVFIEGAADVMAPDSLMIKTGKSITVHFCKPIEAHEFDLLGSNELVERARTAIINKQKECFLETLGAER